MAEPRPRRGHGEDSIYFDQANNHWVGAVSLGYKAGKRVRKTVTGRTKTAVKAKLRQLRQELDNGVRSSAIYTVGNALADWLVGGLSGRSDRTREFYRDTVKPLRERLADVKPRELSAGDVQEALDALADRLSTRSLQALVSEGEAAEHSYIEAVERLGRTPFRTELARAHLVYGEWLRREGRRIDAREHLGPAYELFAAMRAEGFAERARRELQATGETVRKRSQDVDTHQLTPQEENIARVARDGRSNAEISAELFLSVRTVEWHLRKVFMKLGVTSRKGLRDALPSADLHPKSAAHRS